MNDLTLVLVNLNQWIQINISIIKFKKKNKTYSLEYCPPSNA